jgi:hypothetical protein
LTFPHEFEDRRIERETFGLGPRLGDCAGKGVEDARPFLLRLQHQGLGVGSINSHAAGLRFVLRVTLGRSAKIDRVPILKERRTLPTVLTKEEIARNIAAAPGLKYRIA